jgi:hypothetical protein
MGWLGSKLRTQADGPNRFLGFYCPGCERGHVLRVEGPPGRPMWSFDGNAEKPTFSPSVLSSIPARVDSLGVSHPQKTLCHLFVRCGRIEFLSDCAHELAGQTVDLPDWPTDYGWGDE